MTYELYHQMTIGELLATQAEKYGERSFLRLENNSITYAKAERQASALAAGLQQLGLQSGDRLVVILPNIPAFVVTLFAAAKAGLIFVPINTRRHETEVAARLDKTQPTAVVTFSNPDEYHGADHLAMAQRLQGDLPNLRHIIALNGGDGALDWHDLAATTAVHPPTIVKIEDAAVIAHTLGSTGQPRGAILTHGGLVRNAASIATALAATPNDVFLGAIPFSNAFGITPTILACTIAGAELVCLPRYQSGEAVRLLQTAGITIHHGVPTMFTLELNHPDFKPGAVAVRTGIISGAPCPPELVQRVREEMSCNLLQAYGLTEASPGVTITRLDDGPVTAVETVGRPQESVELKVIDEQGRELPLGDEGELCVRGYNVMRGYWNDPEATAQMLDADGWLHTSDLAVIDPNGPVRIVGRKDHVINRGGLKIYPATVEMTLLSHPGVMETAVVGIPDLIYGELACACVVKRPGTAFSEQDLLDFAAERLADYARPDRVLFFDALPRRGSGPVRKNYLREHIRIYGSAWKFGKNIDTDAIIPARRCNTADPRELALYCMEDADAEFVNKMTRGDLIVADSNFGCGSSREVAPLSIKAAGVAAVIAKSFARIFFRNAINIGLPILECPEAVDRIREGDRVQVEPAAGIIRNLTRDETYRAQPFPDFLQRIIDQGGLLAYVEERLVQETT
ncbi:MAG: AMP-binding protein [Chloroflexi bacterium]|nr:AMP-binding protein [Chloroflexota bacterium]